MSAARTSAKRPPRRLRRHPSSFEEGKTAALPLPFRGAKLRGHPVGGLVAVAVPEVVDDVVAAFDHREHAGARNGRGELLGLRVRSETVFRPRYDVDRA